MADRGVTRKLGSLLSLLNLHHTVRVFWALMTDRRVSLLLKVYAWAGIVYFFSPLDVVPDFITGIGLLDDIILALIIMQALLELAPEAVVEEHCRRLGIDPRRVFVSAPRTIQDALELFEWATEHGARPWGGRHRWGAEDEPPLAAEPPAGPPPYSRYSAYRGGQG